MRWLQRSARALPLVLLLGCGTADSQAEIDPETIPEAERYGGIGVVGVWDVDAALNPLTAQYEPARSIVRDLLFLPLVRYDRYGNAIPALAERWDMVRVATDTLVVTFHLRQDVRWHDGVPTTADDVAFTFERLFDPRFGHPGAHDFSLYHKDAEQLDRYTVRLRLQAHPDFLEALAGLPIAPRHLLGEAAPDHIAIHPLGRRPVGNGPFRFTLLATLWPGDITPQMVQAQLRGIGIEMHWQPLGSRALAMRDRSWDAALLRSEERMRRDDAPLFHSRYADSTQSWLGFSHPRMDSLLDLMAVTMDRDAARPFWREYQRLQLEEAPVTVLFYHGPLHVVSRKLQGVEPDAYSIFGSAPRWWIAPAERGS